MEIYRRVSEPRATRVNWRGKGADLEAIFTGIPAAGNMQVEPLDGDPRALAERQLAQVKGRKPL